MAEDNQIFELRTSEGDLLATGRLQQEGEDMMFVPRGRGSSLVDYFFLKRGVVSLGVGGRATAVRLQTRWVNGSRRWRVSAV